MECNFYTITLFVLCIYTRGFQCLAEADQSEDNKYSLLSKMFATVMEEMKVQNERMQALENNPQSQSGMKQSLVKGNAPEKKSPDKNAEKKSLNQDNILQTQLKEIQDDIKQIKDFLTHMSKGFTAEKAMREKNTKALENVVDQFKESLNALNQTMLHHTHTAETSLKLLETNLDIYGGKVESQTENIISNLSTAFKNDMIEEKRSFKDALMNTCAATEKIQSEIELIKPFIFNNLNPNLALRKSASQSSTYGYAGASAATDGVRSGNYEDGSCTHTDNERDPWWQVDLGRSFFINRVVITNRKDCCGYRLRDLEISVIKEQTGKEEICGYFEGPSSDGAVETVICSNRVLGKYLKIQMNATDGGYLTLCEVEVFTYDF